MRACYDASIDVDMVRGVIIVLFSGLCGYMVGFDLDFSTGVDWRGGCVDIDMSRASLRFEKNR